MRERERVFLSLVTKILEEKESSMMANRGGSFSPAEGKKQKKS